MAVNVEILEKLERKITLELPMATIQQEVDARLKRLARQVKMDGFRPGKVPLKVVAQQYGYSVQYEVVNDKVGQAFQSAVAEAQLRVAGAPSISDKAGAADGLLVFEAVFEVYPDVKIGDLSNAEVEKLIADVDDAAIDRTLDILRKQRRTFTVRDETGWVDPTDRVTIDFEGKIDGEPFDGGKAENFQFIVGDGQMLEQFDAAVRGMKTGESKTFPLNFPADYHGKEVAGKTADFLVTVKKIEFQTLPYIDEDFVKSLGIESGTVEALRADIKNNLEREVKYRVLSRNKAAVMDVLVAHAELDLPKSSVQAEVERLIEGARADMKQRGMKDSDNAPIPAELFQTQAERRVRLGLVVAELVTSHQLQATPEQIDAHIAELAASYERPEDVVRWYKGDRNRLAEVEAMVIEGNVTNFVLTQAKVTEKTVSFEELMGQQA